MAKKNLGVWGRTPSKYFPIFNEKLKKLFKMKTLTIQIPNEESKLFIQFLKKFNAKIISENPMPNKETMKAMKELKEGKGIKFNSVNELFKSI